MTSKPLSVLPRKYRLTQGFSLLEAIVALALISLTGMAVFSWLNQSLGNLTRLDRHQSESQLIDNSFSYIKTINPMLTPEGSTELGTLKLSWASKIIESPNRTVSGLGGYTNYEMGLYLLEITLQEGNSASYNFTVRQVGYREL